MTRSLFSGVTVGGLVSILAASLTLIAPPTEAHSIELGGGFQSNFDSAHRTEFGTAGILSLGYSVPLVPERSRFLLEADYLWATADQGQADPTFQRPESKYWVLPIILAVQADLVPGRVGGPVALYLGLGGQTVLTGFTDRSGVARRAPTIGGLIELRPEITLSPTLSIWARQRLSLVGDLHYSGGSGDINYSGSLVQLGLSVTVR